MKAAAFEIERPASLAAASAALRRHDEGRLLAGGQSLGPMLNLRIARPSHLIPLCHLPDLLGAEAGADAVTLGACVTHAAIADGRTPDIGDRILARIADGIAYRAIRNRGTIGGSLCHADPAADWLCTLTALDATVLTWRDGGGRSLRLTDFVSGAFRTALEPGEILHAVRVPRPSPAARWCYRKACRKPGEFAHAMVAVLQDHDRRRVAFGATGGRPLLLTDDHATPDAAASALAAQGLDALTIRMQVTLLHRALQSLAA